MAIGFLLLPLLVGAVLLYFLTIGIRDWYYIHRPLQQARELIKRRNFGEALPLLERAAQVKPRTTPAALLGVYLLLGYIYTAQGRHELAIEQYMKLVDLGKLYELHVPSGTVAEAKAQLAKCYDALGKPEAAAAMRRLALADYGEDLTDPQKLFTRGRLLRAEWRYREAAESFGHALAMSRYREPAMRLEISLHAALSAYEGGRTEDTLRFAREGYALGLASAHTLQCASLAGIAARLLLRPEESVAYYRQAYELAMLLKDLPHAVSMLVLAALVPCFEGRIEEALAQIREAATRSDDSEAQRHIQAGLFECYLLQGRFDEARAAIGQLQNLGFLHMAEQPEHVRALHVYSLARLETMAGNLDQARRLLDQAEAVLRRHEKYGIWCRHLSAWLAALAGEHERARAEVAALETALPALEGDWDTCPSCASDLGKACCHLGEYDRAIALLQRWPEERVYPVNLLERWYYLGECHRAQGNLPAAREWYAKAAQTGFETHYTRLAAERL
ncbi:MAG: tetratricopeptide repeat protein [Armatimonadota bacterium]